MRIASFFRRIVKRQQVEDDLNEEVRSYLSIKTERYRAQGFSEQEARRAARLECEGAEQVKEKVRDARFGAALETMLRDIRYAARMLRKSPVFTAVAVLSLALGIGANTAIFSVIYALVLRSLPVQHPEELVAISHANSRRSDMGSMTYPIYREMRDRHDLFAGVLCIGGMSPNLSIGGSAERVSGELVSANYFDVLGLKPYIGRLFRPDDETAAGANPVAVLSYGFWKRRFGGDPKVVGQVVRLNTTPMTIVGVSPPEFYGISPGDSRDIRVPITMQPQMRLSPSSLDNRNDWWLQVVGRLRPDVPQTRAEAALTILLHRYYDQQNQGQSLTDYLRRLFASEHMNLSLAGTGLVTKAKKAAKQLYVLMAVVALVLLSGCMNLANLLLARTATRQREIAIRLSLGAGRGRLIRQLLTESILLAGAGGVIGILLSLVGSRVLVGFLLAGQTGAFLDVTPDTRVLGFTLALSLLTGMLFGMAPALGATRIELQPELKGAQVSWRKMLISFQVAISLVLLIGAGLFLKSLNRLRAMDLGFDPHNVLQISLDPTLSGYSQERTQAFYRELQKNVSSLPGVLSVSFSSLELVGGAGWGSGITVQDYQVKEGDPGPDRDVTGSGYFTALHIPMIRGRDFGPQDHAQSRHVAIVNESFARFYFGKQDPIGKLIGPQSKERPHDFAIVGIAKDGKYSALREDTRRFWYIPYEQYAETALHAMHMYIRTTGDPLKALNSVRQTVLAIDANIPLLKVTTLERQVDANLATDRMVATLSSFFSFLTVLVVALGLYGAMSYAVTKRTREIGIRMALGAQAAMVLRSLMREATVLVITGVALGLPSAFLLGKLVASLLFEVKPQDLLAFAGATVLISAVTLLAGYLPARRAASINPTVALRHE